MVNNFLYLHRSYDTFGFRKRPNKMDILSKIVYIRAIIQRNIFIENFKEDIFISVLKSRNSNGFKTKKQNKKWNIEKVTSDTFSGDFFKKSSILEQVRLRKQVYRK